MVEKNRTADPVYGVFTTEEHVTVGKAIAMGVFVGSVGAVAVFLVWAIISIALNGPDESTRSTLSWIVAMLCGGIGQQLWFNYRMSSKLNYRARVLGFGLTYFAALLACAWFGQWLPVGNPWAYVGFLATYLIVLAILTAIFAGISRRRGIAYQKALDEYRAKRNR